MDSGIKLPASEHVPVNTVTSRMNMNIGRANIGKNHFHSNPALSTDVLSAVLTTVWKH